MANRQKLATMIQKWADNPDSYFERDDTGTGAGWETSRLIPNVVSDLSCWRLVIPPKEIELEKGSFYFNYYGGTSINLCIAFKYGTVRKTKALAEQSARRVLESNRLSALVDQIAGEPYEFKAGATNTILYRDSGMGKWKMETNTYSYSPERIYGSEETMKKVCHILNDGLFNLKLDT